MKSYEIDIRRGLVDVKTGKAKRKTGIAPKPGEVIDFDGTRLMAVEDYGEEDCSGCVVYESDYRLCMEYSKKKCICLGTLCGTNWRKDGKSIHSEEVKDGQ